MNIEKYWETNIAAKNFDNISANGYKTLTTYTKFIGNLPKSSKVLEIGAGNGEFLYFLEKYYTLDPSNLSTLDISKSVVDSLDTNTITKRYNNHLSDVVEFLEKTNESYDLIVMKHVMEHMEKPYIEKLVPLLMNALNKNGKILVEVPNIINIPLGLVIYFADFSHATPFTDKSMREAFLWNYEGELDIKFYNLYFYVIDYSNPISFIKSLFVKILYYSYCNLLLFMYRVAGFKFEVSTTALVSVVTKK